MTKEQFMQEMASLLDAYPILKNRHKLARIYYFLENLPEEAISKIIMDIGDASKSSPSINDFREASSKWRRDYYAKHGHYYGQEKQVDGRQDFECKRCIDSGIVELYSNEDQAFAFHMRCDCEMGKNSFAKLPMVDKSLKQGFNFKAPELRNFKPLSGLYGELDQKAREWYKIISKSEDHFSSIGYKHDL